MVVVYGIRLFGKIDACAGTYLATRFLHLYYLPLFPLGTQLVLQRDGESYSYVAQPLSGRSILAALLRTWGLLLLLGGLFATVAIARPASEDGAWGALLVPGLAAALGAAAVAAGYLALGRLSLVEQAQRRLYADYVGYPVDVARFGERRAELRAMLRETLGQKAQALGLLGFRGVAAGGEPDHVALALDPTVQDLDYLRGSFALARLEWAIARGPARAAHSSRHAALWSKIEERADVVARAEAARAAVSAAG